VTGLDVTPDFVDRRPGDPARIVASVDRIAKDLGWTSRFELDDMVASAWAGWQHRHP
jgi:UDP-glucose 4-epimerase